MIFDIGEVRRVLENQELEPCFQPVVDLRTGRVSGFEILTRWRHPEFGLILPANLISLADESGLIDSLMEQILRKALLSASLFPEPLTLALNVCPTQMRDSNLPRRIEKIADEAEFSLERLTIEITESALLTDMDQARNIAAELKAMGCRLALDDFGTGYSTLSHLQALPFDLLKIDRSFVASMTKTRESRKIVAATVGLGHSLGLVTVAEGIETEQQADMLLWLGCELGQGWLYGKASPADQVSAIVAAPPRAVSAGLSTPGDGWAVSSLEALPTQRLAQLQAIYDGVPVGLCFLDRKLRYVSLNQRFANMNGASIASHIGSNVREMNPESFQVLEPYLLRALEGEAISEVEIVSLPNVLGVEQWAASLSCQPALDEADEVIGISVAVADIAGHLQMHDSLPEMNGVGDVEGKSSVPKSWIMDPEGNNLFTSSRWVQTTELGRKKMRNLGWLEALHPDDLEATMKTMKNALKSGDAIDTEYRVRNLDGDWRWMRSRGSARLSPEGEIVRWYGTVEEIDESERRALVTA